MCAVFSRWPGSRCCPDEWAAEQRPGEAVSVSEIVEHHLFMAAEMDCFLNTDFLSAIDIQEDLLYFTKRTACGDGCCASLCLTGKWTASWTLLHVSKQYRGGSPLVMFMDCWRTWMFHWHPDTSRPLTYWCLHLGIVLFLLFLLPLLFF